MSMSNRNNSSIETEGLILPFSDLVHRSSNAASRTNYNEAFLNVSIFQFASDETNAMLEILFCHTRCCLSFYNPLYVAVFCLVYFTIIPGVMIHWLLLPIIPVRSGENPEEREMRSQGVYSSIGLAIYSLPFAAVGLYLGTDTMILINKVSLAVNSSIIIYNLVGLKAMADELKYTMRIFAVGVWLIVAILIGLILFDVYSYVTVSVTMAFYFFFRLLQITIYSVVAYHSMMFWNNYSNTYNKNSTCKEVSLSIALLLLLAIIVSGFLVAVVISEQNAWRIMYW